ncbi:ArsR family transcriptional regulator [Pyrococcus sp. ST04]|uniref:ArsR family transcriptional regulator n=1 Tax=Pyrococcus sp. ST04 TaxID=1183377 RepID=UPI0002605E5E|nr:hypothetical protein Py04_0996 [Pyrococcus sp. ST04]
MCVNTLALLKALSNETNLQILSLLRSGSFHPRELARLLQRSESDVSRRLKKLEKLGLVEGRWIRLGDRNVRIYSLKVNEVKVNFLPGEVQVGIKEAESYRLPITFEDVPKTSFFVGRHDEVEILKNAKGKVVVVYGIAGIGKTSLLARVFPEAFWYSMNGSESFEYFAWQLSLYLNSLGYRALMEYLRGGGKEEKELFELILEGIDETESVIVIDDLHKCQDETLMRMLSYLAGRLKKGTIAVASRVKPLLGIEGVIYINLSGLEPGEAYELAKKIKKRIPVDKFAKIYRITRGHPLALILLLESSGESLEEAKENIFEFLFTEIYRSLTEEEKRMLLMLSIFEEPLEYEAIKTLYGGRKTFFILHSLLRKGLVERRGSQYFIHDMLRGFLREKETFESRTYYLEYAEYLIQKNTPRDFLKAFEYILKAGATEKIRELVELRIRRFKHLPGDFPKTYRRILSQAGDNPYARGELGIIYFNTGFFQKARDILLEVEDKIEGLFKAEVVSTLADVFLVLENLEMAERYLQKTKELAEELQDPEVWLWYYMEKTKYEYYRRNLEEALKSAFKELEVAREHGRSPEDEGLVLLHIGDIYLDLEQPEEGIKYYEEGLRVAKAYGLTFIEHVTYMELSKTHYILGNYRKAVSYGNRAVEYFLRIKNYRRAVDALAYRCVSWIGLGEAERAEEDARELIRIAHSTGYPLAWAGYIFMGAAKFLKGEDGSSYVEKGRKHFQDYPWLFEAVIQELERVFEFPKELKLK